MSRSKGSRLRLRAGSAKCWPILRRERVSVLIAESNESHVADLLACAFRIERGSVTRQN